MRQKNEVLEAYTSITEGTDENDRPCFNVWLTVGNQKFCVTPVSYDDREEADWMRHMLANALLQIVKEVKTDGS